MVDDDARLERVTELLEQALELAASVEADERMAEIGRLCRDAADVAEASGEAD